MSQSWNSVNRDERDKPKLLTDVYNQPIFSYIHTVKNGKMLCCLVFY